jgi:hypothetical protein
MGRGVGAPHSFHDHAAGLINPLADQRKINVGLLCVGTGNDDDDRDCVRYGIGAVAGLLHQVSAVGEGQQWLRPLLFATGGLAQSCRSKERDPLRQF